MIEKKKKEYVNPEADVLEFTSEDIITLSGNATLWWSQDDNQEDF